MPLAACLNVVASLTKSGLLKREKPRMDAASRPYVLRSMTTATGTPLTVVRVWTMPWLVRQTCILSVSGAVGAEMLGITVSLCSLYCIGTHAPPSLRYDVESTVGALPSALHSFSMTVSTLSLPELVADHA